MRDDTLEVGWVDTNSLLIEEVRLQPCLYDRSHRRYSDNRSKPPIWEAIAHRLGFRRGREAQRKWNYLRGHYATILRRQAEARAEQELEDPEASPVHVQSGWPHFEQMAFLRPFVKNTAENETLDYSLGFEQEADRSESPGGSLHAVENRPPAPKRPRPAVLPLAAASDDHELQVFTAYLGDRLDALPVKKRRAAELKILELLNREDAQQAD